MRLSVVVTTYNRPDALLAVLEGLADQTLREFEVVVADDGSRPETAELVTTRARSYPVPLLHVWQPDQGFRVSAARNRASAQSRGEYLVFLDGDCIVRPDFLTRHLALAQSGYFISGNRVLLSQAFSMQALAMQQPLHTWTSSAWLAAKLRGDINRWHPLLNLPDASWRRRNPKRWQAARGCNLAMWRNDFLKVNGFDEHFAGWGHEDADIAVRLIRAGVLRKDGRYATAVLHLWHAENDRSSLADNERRLASIQTDHRIRAQLGVDQYTMQA
jgi:glycosyltransferase involved in cell wall biosynthesis